MLAGMRLYKPSSVVPAPAGLVPHWPAPAGVKAFMSTREGGVSPSPWDSLNLGDHVGDAPQRVEYNRALLQDALGVRSVFLDQVHGDEVVTLTAGSAQRLQGDACITDMTRLACTIMVADCLPVLLCDPKGHWVAAAHAGWRGLACGVLEALVKAAEARGTAPGEMLAWLGPCIGPAAFQVGSEVRQAFVEVDPACDTCFVPDHEGKWLADLPGLARRRLSRMGLHQVHGNDGRSDWCTVSSPSRFFSHRRDGPVLGASGRMAALIWLER